jgi:hypothetical protein
MYKLDINAYLRIMILRIDYRIERKAAVQAGMRPTRFYPLGAHSGPDEKKLSSNDIDGD